MSDFTPEPNHIYCMDALELLKAMADGSVNCVVTSPPYFGLRDYGIDGQIGLEPTLPEYVGALVALFREIRRVLRDDGTAWLNLGDTYTGGGRGATPPLNTGAWKQGTNNGSLIERRTDVEGLPSKSLLGVPWRVAFGLQDDGWILRSDIIWNKPNPMPESVTDRPTKAHEYVFLLSKSQKYWYDAEAIKETAVNGDASQPRGSRGTDMPNSGRRKPDRRAGKGRFEYDGKWDGESSKQRAFVVIKERRNKRSVWTVATQSFTGAHFATFPAQLIEPMILAGCPVGGLVLDPFMGSGTTALVARGLGRSYIGCDLNAEYVEMANKRLAAPYTPDMFFTLESEAADARAD